MELEVTGAMPLDRVEALLVAMFQRWIQEHPVIDWMVNHLLLTIGLGMVTILLFWGLLRAIMRFSEQVWMMVLSIPFQGLRLLFNLFQKPFKGLLTFGANPSPSNQERLTIILMRLEELKQEQSDLIEEMKGILGSEPFRSIL
ncbi:hypothetical protein BST81_18065 [Leptolyngbya sp. 'hensonii']|uniref:hypothetical protein n=1 Tax=Leptolyngbya sp. 'hensonii' TaxID=1922337 RepID=UPI0009501350|nr:hypothetical protein [Leptolyngbya sp. 'hensonii']OLP16901.1 hypothetical protein BST81_18065 [Leptolyngbya sp. 'hensonii']